MPISRRGALDASHLDGVLTLDVERGVAAIDLAQVSFVDAYALAGLACFIASAARDGLPVELVVPEDPDVRSWLSRMHRHRGWGRRHRHPGVPAAPVRRHDRRRGHPASGPVGRLPRPGAGPRARASRSRRRRARARRRRLDPERVRRTGESPTASRPA